MEPASLFHQVFQRIQDRKLLFSIVTVMIGPGPLEQFLQLRGLILDDHGAVMVLTSKTRQDIQCQLYHYSRVRELKD